MNELITHTAQLPDTIEDLTQFVLVGKSKLNAYMLKLRTVNRLSVAQEIRNQTLEETQELANALIAAEQRIGELLLAMPKASGGDHGNQYTGGKNPDVGNFAKSKTETIKEMGYGKNEAADYQQMAKNPEIVRKVIEEATANGEVVTKAAVMKQIQQAKEEARKEAQQQINGLAETIKAQSKREAREEVEAELKALRQTNKVLKEQAEKTATVIKPDGYEDTLRELESAQHTAQRAEEDFQRIRKEYAELKKENQQLKDQIGTDKVWKDADKDIRQFTAATNNYIRMYGGHAWAFAEIENISADARRDFLQAIRTLDGFAQQMIQNLGGLIGE